MQSDDIQWSSQWLFPAHNSLCWGSHNRGGWELNGWLTPESSSIIRCKVDWIIPSKSLPVWRWALRVLDWQCWNPAMAANQWKPGEVLWGQTLLVGHCPAHNGGMGVGWRSLSLWQLARHCCRTTQHHPSTPIPTSFLLFWGILYFFLKIIPRPLSSSLLFRRQTGNHEGWSVRSVAGGWVGLAGMNTSWHEEPLHTQTLWNNFWGNTCGIAGWHFQYFSTFFP